MSLTVYVDGKQIGTENIGNITINHYTGDQFAVGYQTDKKLGFDGEISLARVYTKALSKEEIDGQRSAEPSITATDACVLIWDDMSALTRKA